VACTLATLDGTRGLHARGWPDPPAWWLRSPTAVCVIHRESRGLVHTKQNPSYRGKWQFGWPEWRTVGGTGDPANASEAEQDYRAYLYWKLAGWGAWTRYDGC
jgi:hypothetical protein